MTVETYQNSGRMGAIAIPLILLVGGGVSIGLGVVYSYAIAWITIVQIIFLATVAFGAGSGFVVGVLAKVSKVRNNLMTLVFTLVCAAMGLYAAWAFDAKARFGGDVPVLWNPADLLPYIQTFYNDGFWGMKQGEEWSGLLLGGVWLVETIMIFGMAIVTSRLSTKGLPFCEDCDRWTEQVKDLCRLHSPENNDMAVEQLCNGDMSVLNLFTRASTSAAAYLRVDTARCPDCDESNFVSISAAQVTIDKDGNAQVKSQPVIENMKLSNTDMEQFTQGLDSLEASEFPDADDDTA